MSSDLDLPATAAQLASANGSVLTLYKIGDKLGASASSWDLEELKAFRVLKHGDYWCKSFLPPLHDNHEKMCPICDPGASSASQQVCLDVIEKLRVPVTGLHAASESTLSRMPAGRFNLSLVRLRRALDEDSMRKFYTGDGSSDEKGICGKKAQTLVTSLVQDLFYLSLHTVLKQSSAAEEYVFCKQGDSASAMIAGKTVRSEDSGGLSKRRLEDSRWMTTNPFVMIGECKTECQKLLYNDGTGKYCPVLTVSGFAQLVKEVVTIWKQNKDKGLSSNGIYAYIANDTFIRFFHFNFGSRYAEYLDASTENAQLHVAQSFSEDACIRVSSSEWLNLEEPKDVVVSICHVLTRLRVEEATG